ncbi:MAG: type V CRISPR-associated endonuclease Cas1, partial [Candidatus Peribacteria bacterium]|nr:type V CRISPR-associated endonuclease Cas1 [Candidatus Peribacteria bacterium]
MLSRPDFTEKQIVVISSERVKDLSFRNDNLLIKKEGKIQDQISCFKIFCVFIIGECSITTKLIAKLLKYQIGVYCFQMSLKPLCSIGSALAGNYLLREKQYASTSQQDLHQAQLLVKNKIANQGALLTSLRHKDTALKEAITSLKDLYTKVEKTESDDRLRGIEGSASKLFFSHYFKDLKRYKREPRTRADSINLLLDMGYSFLYNFIEANLNLYGFDVYRGVYHKLFYERKSLACDLVEPFRCIIDKSLLKAHHLGQINEKDFTFKNGEYELTWDKREPYMKIFLRAILEKKLDFFDYVKQYYRFVMGAAEEFPYFT